MWRDNFLHKSNQQTKFLTPVHKYLLENNKTNEAPTASSIICVKTEPEG
jgi:hypothetical protein